MRTNSFVLMSGLATMVLLGGCHSDGPSTRATPGNPPPASAGNGTKAPPPPPAAEPATAPPSSQTGPGPRWTCGDAVQEFGEVWQGKKLEFTFHFRNDGEQPLRILEAKSKCGCTVPQDYTKVVEPGREGTAKAILKTSNIEGPLVKTLDIKTNDPSQPSITLRMKGTVKVPFELRPRDGFNFGQVAVDSKLSRTVTLRNKTGSPIELEYLAPRQESKVFHVNFETVRPALEYRVTVSADPPLPKSTSKLSLVFKTSIPDLPEYTLLARVIGASGVVVTPKSIVIRHPYKDAQRRFIRITTYAKTQAEIIGAAVSDPQLVVRRSLANQIEVTLPAQYQPPPYGEYIEIQTNDKDQPTIRLPVIQTPGPRRPARPKDKPLVMTPVKLESAAAVAASRPAKELPPQLGPPKSRPAKRQPAKPGKPK